MPFIEIQGWFKLTWYTSVSDLDVEAFSQHRHLFNGVRDKQSYRHTLNFILLTGLEGEDGGNTAVHYWSFDKSDSVSRIRDELGANTLAHVNGKILFPP